MDSSVKLRLALEAILVNGYNNKTWFQLSKLFQMRIILNGLPKWSNVKQGLAVVATLVGKPGHIGYNSEIGPHKDHLTTVCF